MNSISLFEITKGSSFVILPTLRKPKWIISLKSQRVFRTSFNMYQPTRWRGRLLKFFLKHSFYLQRLFNFKKFEITNLDKLINDCPETYSISLGTSGEEQKPTIAHFSKEGRIVAYSKIGHNDLTRKLVKNEYESLRLLENVVLSFDVPKIITYTETERFTALTESTKPGLVPIKAKINNDLVQIAEEIAMVNGKGTFRHGDYAPWNIKVDKDGNYFIFDWEYSGDNSEKSDIQDMEYKILHFVKKVL